MIFVSKKDDGGNDIGKVRDKFAIEVCKPEEQTDSFNRRGRLPILDGGELGWVHAYITLSDDHAEIFHGGGVKGAFGDFERETVFLKVREDVTSTLVV